jgi:hypothetical protein
MSQADEEGGGVMRGFPFARHSRESGNPAAFLFTNKVQKDQRHWIPAFAGMTVDGGYSA